MKILPLALLLSLASPSGSVPAGSGDHDVLFNAMSDELARSMRMLKLDKHERPYYISYRMDDSEDSWVSASFGAITSNSTDHHRWSNVDVHVGDYSLDSGNFRSGYFGEFSSIEAGPVVSIDDDYDSLRHKLWLQTDQAYKRAVHNLESKKSALQQKNVKERPDDWSHENVVVSVLPVQTLAMDRQRWVSAAKSLSAIFRNYPKIRSSDVRVYGMVQNQYFVNSEGSKTRDARCSFSVAVNATALAADGSEVTDVACIAACDEKHLPPMRQIEAAVQELAERVTAATNGKEAEVYQGPVLFEGVAAAQFFNFALCPRLKVVRQQDSLDNVEGPSNPFQARLGRRVLPTFISVSDDPFLRDSSGGKTPACYNIDLEGVKAQRVALVENGILKTLLSTRVPTLKIQNSNGHALLANGNGTADISNLVIQSDQRSSLNQLRQKALRLGKESGLDYVVVVRKLGASSLSSRIQNLIVCEGDGVEGSGDKISLPAPVTVSKLFVKDGHEEPMRDAEFAECTTRALRDIVGCGNDSKLYYFDRPLSVASISAPSILVSELEVQKSRAVVDKPPALPHPYFDK